MRLDHLVDLPFHGLETERGGRLHRRKLDGRLRQRSHMLLHQDEAPEFAGIEVVHIPTAHVVHRFAAYRRRPLERVLADVDDCRHVGRRFLTRPAPRLLIELELEVIDAKGAKVRPAEIEQLVARRRPLAGQEIKLIVAVQVVLVGPVAELDAFEELLGDVWIARRRGKRRQPVEPGEQAVLHRARLDLARPAGDARHAEPALEYRAFGGAERRHAAIGPGEDFGAVVGRENDDGVVRPRQCRRDA